MLHAESRTSRVYRVWRWACQCLCGCALTLSPNTAPAAAPRVLDAQFELVEFAAAPDIVTPIAVVCEPNGDVLAIESHTHQRPDDYDGPEFDRVRRFRDSNGDGRADQITTFYEATKQSMSLTRATDGSIYLATRRDIRRLRDTDRDGRADQTEVLVTLETKGDYPHNGISGLTWTPDGELLFGLGENLGEPYRLVGQDGSFVRGEGEGGNVFVCHADGSRLRRHATGFWNPFGNAFDPLGRLFTIDNDPDASPPCRMLHVVPRGDYGYQFRYGRSGRHPLQAWDAELPGTLPWAAGTGEAPCQIVPYRGRLWVTCWGDYRLDAYTVSGTGASCQAQLQTIVQGDAEFRPVGLAIAPDGSLFFSDWVNRSYPVHKQGRLWHLIPHATATADAAFPPLSDAEHQAARWRVQADLSAADQADRFLSQAASVGLAHHADFPRWKLSDARSSQQQLALLQAVRWTDPARAAQLAGIAVQEADEEVTIYGLRIIAEQRLQSEQDKVLRVLERPQLGDHLARVTLATLDWLEAGPNAKDQQMLFARLAKSLESTDVQPATLTLQRLALRTLPADQPAVSTSELARLLARSHDDAILSQVIGMLAERQEPLAGETLARLALDVHQPEARRADAIAALAGHLTTQRACVESCADDQHSTLLQREAARVLRRVAPLGTSAAQHWLTDVAIPTGDAAAGRRVFYRANGPRCYVCHTIDDQGGAVGPELSTIHARGDARWIATAIIEPNRDVAPKFTPIAVELRDGRVLHGLPLAGPGDDGQQLLIQSDGSSVAVALDQIEHQQSLTTSIMPTGLADTISADELSDLLAFLSARRGSAGR